MGLGLLTDPTSSSGSNSSLSCHHVATAEPRRPSEEAHLHHFYEPSHSFVHHPQLKAVGEIYIAAFMPTVGTSPSELEVLIRNTSHSAADHQRESKVNMSKSNIIIHKKQR